MFNMSNSRDTNSSNNTNNSNNAHVNCTKCIHFYVTWDPKFPRGCRVYGFKTVKMPSNTVMEATGMPCTAFSPKPH